MRALRSRPCLVYGFALVAVVAALAAGFHQRFEAPIFAIVLWLMNAADRSGVALTAVRRGAGDTNLPMLVALAVFLVLALAVFLILRRSPGRRYMSRVAMLVPAVLLLVGLDTLGYGGGLALQALLLAIAVPTVLLLLSGRYVVGQALLTQGMVVGLVYLTTSGLVTGMGGDDARHLAAQAAHSQVGLLWTPFLVAWTWSHVARTDGIREDVVRWSGFVALAGLLLAALSGLATLLMSGDSPLARGVVHGWIGVLVWGLVVWHAVLRPSVSRPSWMGRLVGCGALCGALLGVRTLLPYAGVTQAERAVVSTASSRTATDVAYDPHLDPRWLGSNADTVGCAGFLACHQAQLQQWSASAHSHSAGAIYATVVGRLVNEEGPAAAGMCAGCHDPMPLITGALSDDAGYPHGDPAHVACGTCHSMIHARTPVGGGMYQVRGDPDFAITGRWLSTAYLLVKTHLDKHRSDWRPPILGSDEQCGACHQNELAGVRLIDTLGQWRTFVAADAERRRCIDCHMPRLRDGENGEGPRDHRFLSGNVSLPGLSSAEREERRRFMADAIALEIRGAELDASGSLELTIELANVASGHGFPTQPLDLTFYAFEARIDGGSWTRLDPESLFRETLLDASGDPLVAHELWKVAASRGGEPILPGEHRTWTYTMEVGHAATVDVRLVHQRLREDFITPEMRAADLMLDPVVVRENSAPVTQGPRAAHVLPASTALAQR